MPPWAKILSATIFSVVASEVLMAVVEFASGEPIPRLYWAFGALCPLVISAPIAAILVRQSERNRLLGVKLARAYEQMKQLAEVDQMTGALNRAAFIDRAAAALARGPGHVVLFDIDRFKAINDRHGHAAGDDALRSLAAQVRALIGSGDLFGRIGGEEFALYLPAADQMLALAAAERIRAAVELLIVLDRDGAPIPLTISAGVAGGAAMRDIDEALHLADSAMYDAKRDGRNRVRLAA